jgi:hypothetical protein
MSEASLTFSKVIHNLMDEAGRIINRSANTMEQSEINILIGLRLLPSPGGAFWAIFKNNPLPHQFLTNAV